jgi:hypothetical protein
LASLSGTGQKGFCLGDDYGPGEVRQHWTLSGLEKLIALRLWKTEFDSRGRVRSKSPTVEMIMRLADAQRTTGGVESALGSGSH